MVEAEVLLFDLDGTLVDSSQDIVTAVNAMLRYMGTVPRTSQEVVSFVGHGERALMASALGTTEPAVLERALTFFSDYYVRHLVEETRLYPDVIETLRYLHKQTKCIVTNRSRSSAQVIVREMGLEEYFACVVTGDDSSCVKPSPCPVNRALAGIAHNRRRTMMIGDMDVDILAGKGAGVLTCGVTYGIGSAASIATAQPDFVIENFSELRAMIR
ncbi:MAG: HAD-IA family hydrolase [Candidatus Omnitrophica bacterium]|nr:HAD-IA family hydrolase [Candidatus Omnitrophota bacterium]